MSQTDRTSVRLETALAALPAVGDLRPLAEVLADASRVEDEAYWSRGARLSTIEKRVVRLADLEERIPELAERARARTERVMTLAVAALRAIEARDEAAACRHLVAAGEVEEAEGRTAEAERYYTKALEIGRRPRDRRGESLALRRLARLARAAGRLDTALDLYRRSRDVSEAARDTEGFVVGSLGTGHVFADQGRWVEARECYMSALTQLEDRAAPEFFHLCNALSVAERRLGDLSASAEWLERGEEAVSGSTEPGALAHLRHGRGKLHLSAGELAAAESVFREALKLVDETAARVVILLNLAESLRASARPDHAERVAREAEQLAIAHGDLLHLPAAYLELGELAGARGDRDGFIFFEQALQLLRDRGDPPLELATAQRAYGAFDARTGEHESAVARLRVAEGIYRSIGSFPDAEQIAREILELTGGMNNSSGNHDVED